MDICCYNEDVIVGRVYKLKLNDMKIKMAPLSVVVLVLQRCETFAEQVDKGHSCQRNGCSKRKKQEVSFLMMLPCKEANFLQLLTVMLMVMGRRKKCSDGD